MAMSNNDSLVVQAVMSVLLAAAINKNFKVRKSQYYYFELSKGMLRMSHCLDWQVVFFSLFQTETDKIIVLG